MVDSYLANGALNPGLITLGLEKINRKNTL
jgi:hypothetical protein